MGKLMTAGMMGFLLGRKSNGMNSRFCARQLKRKARKWLGL